MVVKNILMDMEFEKSIYELMDQTAVNTSVDKKYYHKIIVTNIVYFVVLCLNYFPVKNVVSNKHSPQAIVVNTNLIWKKHCKVF